MKLTLSNNKENLYVDKEEISTKRDQSVMPRNNNVDQRYLFCLIYKAKGKKEIESSLESYQFHCPRK